jgi:hypothetical protein
MTMLAYDRLSQIVPSDQALAAKAVATSLQQIAGITNMVLPVLANTVSNLKTTNNLNQVSALTQAVPSSVANTLINLAGTDGNSVGICDVLGIAAGYQVTDVFTNTVSTLANTNTTYLTTVYQTMDNSVTGTYGDPINGPVIIPLGHPAAGTYYANIGNVGNITNVVITTASDNSFTGDAGNDGMGNVLPATGPGLFSVTYSAIGNIVSSSPTQVAVLNSNFSSIGAQIVQEKNLQTKAQIDFANLIPNNSPTVYSLIYSLHSYGQQTEQGGQAQFWEGISDLTTFTGQSVVATLREGQNTAVLGNAGIRTDSVVPDTPNPPIPQANLIPSTYTSQQAANIIAQ